MLSFALYHDLLLKYYKAGCLVLVQLRHNFFLESISVSSSILHTVLQSLTLCADFSQSHSPGASSFFTICLTYIFASRRVFSLFLDFCGNLGNDFHLPSHCLTGDIRLL